MDHLLQFSYPGAVAKIANSPLGNRRACPNPTAHASSGSDSYPAAFVATNHR